MAYQFFTEKLIQKGVDVASIFPEKQQQAKQLNNTNYSLPEIVNWLRDNTNNFKKAEPYFVDLDQAVKRIVYNFYENSKQPNPFEGKVKVETAEDLNLRKAVEVGAGAVTKPVSVESAVSSARQGLIDAIESIKISLEFLEGEDKAKAQESVEALETSLEFID